MTDADLLASVNAFPADWSPEMRADWLTDHDVTLASVLLLFAGTAPEHTDGLAQAALVAWLRATEPEQGPTGNVVWSVVRYRWQAVERVSIEQYRAERDFSHRVEGPAVVWGIEAIAADAMQGCHGVVSWENVRRWCGVAWHSSSCPVVASNQTINAIDAAVARARRWLKREVLALFPKVEIRIPCPECGGTRDGGTDDEGNDLGCSECDRDGKVSIQAPDLISLEWPAVEPLQFVQSHFLQATQEELQRLIEGMGLPSEIVGPRPPRRAIHRGHSPDRPF